MQITLCRKGNMQTFALRWTEPLESTDTKTWMQTRPFWEEEENKQKHTSWRKRDLNDKALWEDMGRLLCFLWSTWPCRWRGVKICKPKWQTELYCLNRLKLQQIRLKKNQEDSEECLRQRNLVLLTGAEPQPWCLFVCFSCLLTSNSLPDCKTRHFYCISQ